MKFSRERSAEDCLRGDPRLAWQASVVVAKPRPEAQADTWHPTGGRRHGVCRLPTNIAPSRVFLRRAVDGAEGRVKTRRRRWLRDRPPTRPGKQVPLPLLR